MQRLRPRSMPRSGSTVRPLPPRAAGLLVAVALAVGGMAGCSTSDGGTTVTATATPAAPRTGPTAAGTVVPAAVGTTGAAGGSDGAGHVDPACGAASLAVRSVDSEGAAGSTYEKLLLTNTGPASCTLRGFPGVSYLDGAGRQVGATATHDGPLGAMVRLAPGGAAAATLRTVHPGIQTGCEQSAQITPVTRLRIHPPGSSGSLQLARPGGTACASPAVQQLLVSTVSG